MVKPIDLDELLLTYQILGSCFVYQEYHKDHSVEEIVRFVGEVSQAAESCLSDKT